MIHAKWTDPCRKFAVLMGMLAVTCCVAHADDIEYEQQEHPGGYRISVRRDGRLMYELFSKGKGAEKNAVYRFYWNEKVAATVLLVAGKASVQVAAGVPVSYSISLDSQQRPEVITIEDAGGNAIDGYLTKDGKLLPIEPSHGD